MIEAIRQRLSAREAVKISSFGSILPHDKGPSVARNSSTGEAPPISARRVVFQPLRILENWVNERMSGFGDDTPTRR